MRSLFRLLAFLLTAFCACGLFGPSRPHQWRVTADGTGDFPTIQAAVDRCKPGDFVVLAPGTFTWASQGPASHSMVTLRAGITIQGEAGAAATVIDGQNQGRLIYCENAGSVHIEGLTLQHGVTRASAPGMQPVVFERGGAIHADDGTSLTVDGCVIRENRVLFYGYGAGVYCYNATIRDTEIADNIAASDSRGIGVTCFGTLRVSRCTIRNHVAGGDPGSSGAGISMVNGNVEDSRFEDNRVGGEQDAAGGALSIGSG